MTDELVIATSILALATIVLAGATIAYAKYTRQQVSLLMIGHELTRQSIALTRRQVAIYAITEYHVHNVPNVLNEQVIDNKIKDLRLE